MAQPEGQSPQFTEQSTTFQDVADFAYSQATRGSNQLELKPSTIEGGGFIVPVSSNLSTKTPIDAPALSIAGDRVVHGRSYPAMQASATLVGLWPEGNQGEGEAALYEATTTFQPAPIQRSLPLVDAILEVLGRDQARVIDAPQLGNGTIVLHGDNPLGHLQAGNETKTKKESNEDDVTVRYAFRGRMTVARLYGLLRIDGGVIYDVDAPQGDGYDIEAPEDDPVLTEWIQAVPERKETYGNYIYIDESGAIVQTHHLQKFRLPMLPLGKIVELISSPLPWKDTTRQLLQGGPSRRGMKDVVRLEGAHDQLASLYGQAADRINKSRELPLKPSVVGSAVVLAALRSMPEGPPRDSDIVTLQRLERTF